MTLDPRWSIAVAVLIAVLNYVVGASALLVDAGADAGAVKRWLALANFVSGLLATINIVLTGIPSKDNTTGFIFKGPQPKPPG